MRLFNKLFFVTAVFIPSAVYFFSCTAPQQQRGYPDNFPAFRKEIFHIDPIVFFDTDSLKPRLDLYLEIPAENIIFKINNANNKYESKILITVNIKYPNGEYFINKSYDESASYTEEQMKTISGKSHYYFYNSYINPGNYKIEIKIKDSCSNIEYNKSTDFSVKDFNPTDISFSDLMILSKYKVSDDGTKEITPLISNNIFGLKEFFFFFEIINNKEEDVSKEYIYRIKDNKNVTVKENVFSCSLSPGRNRKTERITISKELKKYLPEEPDFDFYLFDDNRTENFKLEIADKTTNEIVTVKKLFFYPNKIRPKMMHGPRAF